MQRDLKGRNYYEFEFTAKTHRFTRHTLAVVAVNDGECTGQNVPMCLQAHTTFAGFVRML